MIERCPGQESIWGDLIEDLERIGQPKLAAIWAERLCKEGRYHHGAGSAMGRLGDVKPFEEEWSCWNCKFEVTRVTKVKKCGTQDG